MLLTATACGGNTKPTGSTGLHAGFGRVDISQVAHIGMGGYGDNDTRLSGAILDPIYATCVAFREGEQTFLAFTVDVSAANDATAKVLRNAVSDTSPYVSGTGEKLAEEMVRMLNTLK